MKDVLLISLDTGAQLNPSYQLSGQATSRVREQLIALERHPQPVIGHIAGDGYRGVLISDGAATHRLHMGRVFFADGQTADDEAGLEAELRQQFSDDR